MDIFAGIRFLRSTVDKQQQQPRHFSASSGSSVDSSSLLLEGGLVNNPSFKLAMPERFGDNINDDSNDNTVNQFDTFNFDDNNINPDAVEAQRLLANEIAVEKEQERFAETEI